MGPEIKLRRVQAARLRLLTSTLLLTGSLAVQAEWQPYATAEVGGDRYYLDPATLQPTPVGFAVVVLSPSKRRRC